jgi:DNA-binding NarL/FixJ family response regulator
VQAQADSYADSAALFRLWAADGGTAARSPGRIQKRQKMTPDADSTKRRIFIVDDHPLVREWLINLINQQPDLAVCGEAATAAEAIRAVPASNPEVAIVEISLKDCVEIEWIGNLKKACPGLNVLVLSVHDEFLYAKRSLRAGAKGYIMKREATQKVIEALRKVLHGKFYISEAVAEAVTAEFVEGKTLATCSPTEQLSNRELAVFGMLGQGIGTRQIAERLGVNIKTVQVYCARIKEKLNLDNATDLLREAIRHCQTQNQ